MNNTLTGLGLALVLALLAALIGPWFVNWTAYRDSFAREATALVGTPVKVSGAVDVRLLPTPYARVRGVSAGSGATTVSVDEIELELGIAPLLRGEIKAERAKLVRPRIGVEIASDGTVRTALSGARKTAADGISLDRIEIIDGSLQAAAPFGRFSVDHVAGVAEAGSLAGPFRFEGAGGPDNARIQARLSTSRADEKGALRFKIALQREGRPDTFEADGGLTVGPKPAVDARLTLSSPAPKGSPPGKEPWRLTAEAKGDPARVALSGLDLVYGPDDRAIRLGGRGELALAARPRLDLAVESRQVDLDRFLGDGRPKTPSSVISAVAERFGGALAPAIDGTLSLDVRGLVVGGDVAQDVSAEFAADAGGWRVRKAFAKLPGGASVVAKGAVAFSGADPGFAGDVDVSVADLAGLRRWLAGGDEIGGPVRSLGVKGRVAAGLAAVSVEDATLVADGARSTGRLAWRAGSVGDRDRYEAALDAENLDLDSLGLDRLVKSALSGNGSDVALALDAKTLKFAGVKMSDVSIDGSLKDGALDLRRLEIRDAGGAALNGAGRIATGKGGPEGHVSFDVASERLAPLLALARATNVPEPAVMALEARAAALAPLKLQVDVEAGSNGETVLATGDVAGGRLDGRLSSRRMSPDEPAEIDVRIASPDGARLAALFGVGVSPAVTAPGGEISLKASGALSKGMTGEGRLQALGVDLTAKGAVALAPVVGLSGEGATTLKSDDLTVLLEAIGRLTPGAWPKLPTEAKAKVSYGPEGLAVKALDGVLAGVALKGALDLPSDPARPVTGDLAFAELPSAVLGALALSPAQGPGGADARSPWSTTPFGPAVTRGLSGRIGVTAARMPLAGSEIATDARFTLAVRPSGFAVENFAAALAGGRLSGSANVARTGGDATVAVALTLDDAAADQIVGLSADASPVAGKIDLKLESQATGRSPSALMGAFTGAGSITLRDARIRRLDAAAIDRIEPQVEAGLALEAPKIAGALDREISAGDLTFDRVTAPFTLSAGVARTGGLSAESEKARLGGSMALDVRRVSLDADLTLQPNRPDAPQIGVSFEGPVAAPKRRIDATAFTGWLSVRAVERETKRIDAMEADIRERARIAKLRQEEEKKKADEDKRRLDEERRKADAERKKREAEVRALTDAAAKPAAGLPPALDLSAPAAGATPGPRVTAPTGVFSPPQGRPGGGRAPQDAPGAPQSILPPGIGR